MISIPFIILIRYKEERDEIERISNNLLRQALGDEDIKEEVERE